MAEVFVSWSGQRSRAVAAVLAKWLPIWINEVEPWYSTDGIRKGARWFEEISRRLSSARAGIVVVTAENLDSRWLHYEAGALVHPHDAPRPLTPLLVNVTPDAVIGPLTHYQSVILSQRDQFLGLLATLASVCERPPANNSLASSLHSTWDAFLDEAERSLAAIPTARSVRSEQELLADTVNGIRHLERIYEEAGRFAAESSNPLTGQERRALDEIGTDYRHRYSEIIRRFNEHLESVGVEARVLGITRSRDSFADITVSYSYTDYRPHREELLAIAVEYGIEMLRGGFTTGVMSGADLPPVSDGRADPDSLPKVIGTAPSPGPLTLLADDVDLRTRRGTDEQTGSR